MYLAIDRHIRTDSESRALAAAGRRERYNICWRAAGVAAGPRLTVIPPSVDQYERTAETEYT